MSLPPSRHRHRLVSLLLLVGTCFTTLSMAASTPQAVTITVGPSPLAAQIDAYIGQPRFAAASWGIAVVSLDSGHTLYAHRADQLLQPASTAKLFTAGLSLATFGTDYRIAHPAAEQRAHARRPPEWTADSLWHGRSHPGHR
ncbi:D-alanyl-D-alanine carboxypeptidase [Rhodanobacter umsongensis]